MAEHRGYSFANVAVRNDGSVFAFKLVEQVRFMLSKSGWYERAKCLAQTIDRGSWGWEWWGVMFTSIKYTIFKFSSSTGAGASRVVEMRGWGWWWRKKRRRKVEGGRGKNLFLSFLLVRSWLES